MPKYEEINAATATPVLADVSPSIHPDIFADAGKVMASEENPATQDAYRMARVSARDLYEGMHAMEQAVIETNKKFATGKVVDGAGLRRDLPDEHKEALANQLTEKFGKLARAFDTNYRAIKDTADTLSAKIEKTLASPSKDAVTAAAASDIRAYVRALPDGQRSAFVFKAIDDHDHEVAAAVLSTTPWTSGFDRPTVAMIKDHAAKMLAPQEYAHLQATTKVLEGLQHASDVVVARYRHLLPHVRESAHAAAVNKLKE